MFFLSTIKFLSNMQNHEFVSGRTLGRRPEAKEFTPLTPLNSPLAPVCLMDGLFFKMVVEAGVGRDIALVYKIEDIVGFRDIVRPFEVKM